MIVAPLLFQAAFNYALYPPVIGQSSRLSELAPMGNRRFIKSSGTSLSADHPCYRSCVVSEPEPELSPCRISRPICPVEEGTSSAGTSPTVGRSSSPDGYPLGIVRFNCCPPARADGHHWRLYKTFINHSPMGEVSARVVKHGQRR